MHFSTEVYVTDDDYLRTYNVMRLGDIAFEGHSNREFAHGRFVENDLADGIVSHIFIVLRPRVPYDLKYWRYAINNERLMRDVLTRSTKASTMMHDLVIEDFLQERILVPSLQEQRAIGALFARLDSLITLHQRKQENVWYQNGAWNGLTNPLVFRTPLVASSPSCTPTVARMDTADGADRVAAGSVPMAQTFVCAPGDASAAEPSEHPFALRGMSRSPGGD